MLFAIARAIFYDKKCITGRTKTINDWNDDNLDSKYLSKKGLCNYNLENIKSMSNDDAQFQSEALTINMKMKI
uniref:Uncharacterized protein n=1 Tax=Onchocerca volvulus TaxID=6282 RepID=A0A8R1U154_ONCVO